MARAQDVDSYPVTLPPSIQHIRRNSNNLNLGYLLLMKSVGEVDINMAMSMFKLPQSVTEKIAEAPYQTLAEVSRALTVNPMFRSDLPETVWPLIEGVISGEVKAEELGAYIISIMGK